MDYEKLFPNVLKELEILTEEWLKMYISGEIYVNGKFNYVIKLDISNKLRIEPCEVEPWLEMLKNERLK